MSGAKIAAIVSAILIVGVAVVYSISPRLGATQTSTGSGIPSTSTATLTPSFSTSGSSYCPEITVTFANMTWVEPPACAPPSILPSQFENATLDSPQVQAFIKNAYEYHRVYYRTGSGSQQMINGSSEQQTDEILNVTGRQIVNGNWSSGYVISYVDNHLLNITVAPAQQSYIITHMAVYNLPDRSYAETFTVLQRQVINGALSNSTVKSLMIGGPYYVRYVSLLENNTIVGPPKSSGNNTIVIPDSYFVQFNLVNGTAYVSAYLDKNFTTLASTYTDQDFSAECFGNGLIISDPWWFYSGEIIQNNRSCPP